MTFPANITCPGAMRILTRAAATAAVLAIVLVSVARAGAPEPGASEWARGHLSQARLIGAYFDGEAYVAGLEIRLAPGAHTYWRDPGEGGLPPEFDFSQSQNLAAATPLYPAPMRGGKPGEQFIGYERMVVFPIRIKPATPARPVSLALELLYGACDTICIPERASLRLELAPDMQHASHATLIARFAAAVPRPLSEAEAPDLALEASEPGKRWLLRAGARGPAIDDVFVESSDSLMFGSQRLGDDAFEIVLLDDPVEGKALPALRVTVTTDQGAFEGEISLP